MKGAKETLSAIVLVGTSGLARYFSIVSTLDTNKPKFLGNNVAAHSVNTAD